MGNSTSSGRLSRRRHRNEATSGGSGRQAQEAAGTSQAAASAASTAAAYPSAPRPAVQKPQAQAQSSAHEATTVRNLVNLKKHTLRLAPREGSPHILDISFNLDVVSPCRVSMFAIAQEEHSTGAITAKKIICEGAECPMNIAFPFEGLPREQSSIDTAPYEAHEVNAADISLWKYPLIVRLETLADKPGGSAAAAPAAAGAAGAAAGARSLGDRAAGAAMAPWVQSQTTYVVLGETAPDADDDSKVVRQRIYVQGQHYLLQEIYGITEANNARSTSANVDDDFGAYCVVCLSNRKNTTVLPCRHFCMCDDCAKLLLKRTRTCPMCRLPITSVLNIQIRQGSGGGGGGGAAITGPAAAGSGGGAAVAAAAEPTTAAAS